MISFACASSPQLDSGTTQSAHEPLFDCQKQSFDLTNIIFTEQAKLLKGVLYDIKVITIGLIFLGFLVFFLFNNLYGQYFYKMAIAPFQYVFGLYQKAAPGEQLTFLSLPVKIAGRGALMHEIPDYHTLL